MFINNEKDSRGFTLIEASIAMLIAFVAAMAMYALLISIPATRSASANIAYSQHDPRQAERRMLRELCESSANTVWIDSSSGQPDGIIFYTPRDENNAFHINKELAADGKPLDDYGVPIWQSSVAYRLESDCIYRYKAPGLISDMITIESLSEGELISSSIEQLHFSLVDDMLTVYIRASVEPNSDSANLAESHSDFCTTIEFRN